MFVRGRSGDFCHYGEGRDVKWGFLLHGYREMKLFGYEELYGLRSFKKSEICPESDRYMENALWGWQGMKDPGDITKHCWVPEVRYMGSESEGKALIK